MGLFGWIRHREPEPEEEYEDYQRIDPLAYLPYYDEFDRDQRAKLQAVQAHTESGESFYLFRQFRGHAGGRPQPVFPLDEFPTQEDVEKLVEDEWGGGKYGVYADAKARRHFKTYVVEGPSKMVGASTKRASATGAGIRQRIEQSASDMLDQVLATNPEAATDLMLQVLSKNAGVKLALPTPQSAEDKIFLQALEDDPQFKVEWLESERRRRGLKGAPKEKTEMQQLIVHLEEFKKMQELLGGGKKDDDISMKAVIHDVIGGAVEVIKTNPGILTGQPGPAALPVAAPPPAALPPGQRVLPGQPILRPLPPTQPELPLAPRVAEAVPAPEPAPPAPVYAPQMPEVAPPSDTLALAPGTDWMKLMGSVDWEGVERGLTMDSTDYVQSAFLAVNEQGSAPHEALIDFLCNNQPQALIAALQSSQQNLRSPFVRPLLAFHGLSDDGIDALLRVVDTLVTEPGQEWLTQACIAARYIQNDVEQAVASQESSVANMERVTLMPTSEIDPFSDSEEFLG